MIDEPSSLPRLCRDLLAALPGAFAVAIFERGGREPAAEASDTRAPAMSSERLMSVVHGALWHSSFSAWRDELARSASAASGRDAGVELRVEWPDLHVVVLETKEQTHAIVCGLSPSATFALARIEMIAAAQRLVLS